MFFIRCVKKTISLWKEPAFLNLAYINDRDKNTATLFVVAKFSLWQNSVLLNARKGDSEAQ